MAGVVPAQPAPSVVGAVAARKNVRVFMACGTFRLQSAIGTFRLESAILAVLGSGSQLPLCPVAKDKHLILLSTWSSAAT